MQMGFRRVRWNPQRMRRVFYGMRRNSLRGVEQKTRARGGTRTRQRPEGESEGPLRGARSARPTARQTPRTGFALRASLASDAAPARQGGGAERRARGATTSDRQKNEARRAQRRERAYGASGSIRGEGSPQGRDRAGAACVTGRPSLRETRAPRACRWRGERRARAHAARGGGGRKRGDANAGTTGSPPPRASARRGVPARRVRCTRGGARSPRLGRGATRTRGGGGGLTPPRGEQ